MIGSFMRGMLSKRDLRFQGRVRTGTDAIWFRRAKYAVTSPWRVDVMNDNPNKTNKTSFAIVGFVAGALTVALVFFALKGC